jgi:hypothetical protein
MTERLPALLLAALALAPLALVPAPAAARGPDLCPPGLAKKNPPCVPPGLARSWRAGDRYDGAWREADWWRYDLPRPGRGETWLRVTDDVVLRVNDETRAILDIMRLGGVVLSN